MIYVEVHGSSSLKSWSHVILATSTVTLCACGAGICTNINKALVKSRRAFTVPSIVLQTSHQAYLPELALVFARLRMGVRPFAHGRTTMKHFVLSNALSGLVIVAVSATAQAAHYHHRHHHYWHHGYPVASYWNYYRTDWRGRGNSEASTR